MARKSRKPQALTTDSSLASIDTAPEYSVAIYARLSIEDNNLSDNNSIEAQKEMLLSFVEEQDDLELHAVYCDNGFTGSNFERDDFCRMMDDIRDGKVNCIVVKDLSRFGRNYIETGNYIEKIFPFMGVRFVSINDGYDSNRNSAADIMVTLRNIVNHAYINDISRKIKTMFDTKQSNGDFIGWTAPYGFLKSEDNNNRLIIDPESAPIVKQIYGWKSEGLGYVTIARKLNEMEIPSPRMRNVALGRYKNAPTDGLYWSDASVTLIIRNPVYAGHMAQHKFTRTSVNGKQKQLDSSDWVIIRDTHEGIVSDELWNTVQAVTKQNADSYGVNSRKRRTDKGDNLLKGILYCPHCNKAMQQRVDKVRGYEYRYYHCMMRRANPNCTTERMREDEIISVVFEAVRKEISAAADVQKLLDKVSKCNSHIQRLNYVQQSIRDLNMRVKRNAALKSRLFDAYGDELITEQEFRRMKDEYADEVELLQSELARLEAEHAHLSSAYSKENERISSFLKFKKQKALTKDMLTELIEKIIVHGSDSIEIVWRFADEYKAICKLAKAGEQ